MAVDLNLNGASVWRNVLQIDRQQRKKGLFCSCKGVPVAGVQVNWSIGIIICVLQKGYTHNKKTG